MAHRKKCPECNGCMTTMHILPHRFYYCSFCRTYYGGQDNNLKLVDKTIIERLLCGDTDIYPKKEDV